MREVKHGPVIAKQHKLNEHVRKTLNVSSSEDLFNKKYPKPGPGQYDVGQTNGSDFGVV